MWIKGSDFCIPGCIGLTWIDMFGLRRRIPQNMSHPPGMCPLNHLAAKFGNPTFNAFLLFFFAKKAQDLYEWLTL